MTQIIILIFKIKKLKSTSQKEGEAHFVYSNEQTRKVGLSFNNSVKYSVTYHLMLLSIRIKYFTDGNMI